MRKNYQISNLITKIKDVYGSQVTSADIRGFCAANNLNYQTVCKKIEFYKTSRSKWDFDITEEDIQKIENEYHIPSHEHSSATTPSKIAILKNDEGSLVPEKDNTFVRFGNFGDIKKIIQSNIFYPTFITGQSGNGKTFAVEQACSQLKRELVRVNITIETDEDDLIGGFRLVGGETVWNHGPVITALTRGSILLLDEIDLASNKIMCLQSILEGKGIFLKKIGQYIHPTPGFNIIATANTKGKGSEDGRFIGTNILNEAFLERFAITLEQDYPTPAIERRILHSVCESINMNDESSMNFCNHLATWAELIRKSFEDGATDEIISTRRLVHIVKAYKIFGDKQKAIGVCVNRFDDETKESFIEFYNKIDSEVENKVEENNPSSSNLVLHIDDSVVDDSVIPLTTASGPSVTSVPQTGQITVSTINTNTWYKVAESLQDDLNANA